MMISPPISSHHEEGVLYLTLNTPGCEVNVFSAVVAEQLLEIFANIDPRRVRAVVIRSSKPGSYINGARLMGAAIVRSPRSLKFLSRRERSAYHIVGDCAVPTIAVVQGTCYGCGVEFTLFCDYTIAVNTGDTCFYMTELNDNLINTTFEGNIRLPLLMGVEPSIDFLLWGARLNAREALQVGLADQVVEHSHIQHGISKILDTIQRSGRWRRHEERLLKNFRGGIDEKIIEKTQRRIAELPPSYQKEYSDCLALVVKASRGGKVSNRLCQEEVIQCGRSLVKKKGKKALSFFYIRQMARNLCLKSATPQHVVIQTDKSLNDSEFKAELVGRWYPGITFQSEGKADDHPLPGSLRFYLFKSELNRSPKARRAVEKKIAVKLDLNRSASRDGADAVLYNPYFAAGRRFFELSAVQEEPWLGSLSKVLTHIGYQVLPTRSAQHFALDHFLGAYLAPLVRYRLLGGAPETINYTLRKFGFIRRPHALLAPLEDNRVTRLLDSRVGVSETRMNSALRALRVKKFAGGHYDRRLIDALCLSLLATTMRCLDDGTLGHVSLVDLLAREALDFPLIHGSLCKYLTLPQVRTMVKRVSRRRKLIEDDEIALAQDFISSGRRFYL